MSGLREAHTHIYDSTVQAMASTLSPLSASEAFIMAPAFPALISVLSVIEIFRQLSKSRPEQQYNCGFKDRLRGVKWDIASTYGFSDF
jgi:hypothetical protein